MARPNYHEQPGCHDCPVKKTIGWGETGLICLLHLMYIEGWGICDDHPSLKDRAAKLRDDDYRHHPVH